MCCVAGPQAWSGASPACCTWPSVGIWCLHGPASCQTLVQNAVPGPHLGVAQDQLGDLTVGSASKCENTGIFGNIEEGDKTLGPGV